MPTVHLNSALHGVSGHFGDLVYRRYRGRTILQRRARFTQPWSAAQEKTRATFAGGSAYAAQVAADPALRALYAQRGARRRLNFRQMAIRDYFNPPSLGELDRTAYRAGTGGRLAIEACDDFEVVRVSMELHDASGTVTTQSDAAHTGRFWECQVPAPATGVSPPRAVTVTAYDRPGNATARRFPL